MLQDVKEYKDIFLQHLTKLTEEVVLESQSNKIQSYPPFST
jgi:hypothetical protein